MVNVKDKTTTCLYYYSKSSSRIDPTSTSSYFVPRLKHSDAVLPMNSSSIASPSFRLEVESQVHFEVRPGPYMYVKLYLLLSAGPT